MVRTELAALLAAARAEPDEDTPRLAIADWLDEQGGPRDARLAARIRAQIARPTRVERNRAELRKLFPALVAADKDFEGELARGTLSVTVRPPVFCGAPFQRLCDAEDRHWVQSLWLPGVPDRLLEPALSSPLVRSVRELRCSTHSTGRFFVLRLPKVLSLLDEHAPDLDALAFTSGDLQEAGFRALLAWPRFARLRRLGLRSQLFGDACVAAWRESGAGPPLEALDLRHGILRSPGLADLVRLPFLAALRELNLSQNYIEDPGADVLAGAVFRGTLRVLRWESFDRPEGDRVLEPVLRGLLAPHPWPALKVLELPCPGSRGSERPFSAYEFLHPDRVPRLHAFGCEAWAFTPEAVAALARNGFLRQLRELQVGARYGAAALPLLARCADLSGLEVLTFAPASWIVEVNARDWGALVGSDVFRSLHRLELNNTDTFTAEHAKTLVESPHFPALEVVRVGKRVSQEVRKVLRARFRLWV